MKFFHLRKNEYRDSFYLMKLSAKVSKWPGVSQAVIVMGTESNKRILKQVGLFSEEVRTATANDLIIAIEAAEPFNDAEFLAELNKQLTQPDPTEPSVKSFPDLRAALRNKPEPNVVEISIPGEHAAALAHEALENGRHVFCFSHHIPVEEEIALKKLALEKGVLMMGPDCGTAILDGYGLGFANQVRPGTIGVVSASGSGLQEVISLIHRAGGGIAQAVGVGGRDMSAPVNGMMAEAAVYRLGNLPQTSVMVILAKKVSGEARRRVLHALRRIGLPAVVQFPEPFLADETIENGVFTADTYEECARMALTLAGVEWKLPAAHADPGQWITTIQARLNPNQKKLRGLYAGGSLCGEAAQILISKGIPVHTNLAEPFDSYPDTNLLIDLGAEEFTEGHAHPFIDPRLRALEINRAFADSSVGVLLLDIVLGWGCHQDPAGEVILALNRARDQYRRDLAAIASVCGTSEDPQNYEQQSRKLQENGVYVAQSNSAAARLAADLLLSMKRVTPKPADDPSSQKRLLGESMILANVGLPIFEEGPRRQGAEVLTVNWRPAQKVSADIDHLLDTLL